jgi:hypothetical protein
MHTAHIVGWCVDGELYLKVFNKEKLAKEFRLEKLNDYKTIHCIHYLVPQHSVGSSLSM